MSAEFAAIQDGFKSAVAAADKDALGPLALRAERVRGWVAQIGELSGKQPAAEELGKRFDAYCGSAVEAASLMLQVKEGDLAAAVGRLQPALQALTELLERSTAEAARDNEAGIAAAQAAIEGGMRASLLTAGIVVVLMIAGAWAVIAKVTRQLGGDPAYAVQVLHEVATGDLTGEIRLRPGDQDSLLWAAKSMQQRLAGLLDDVRRSAESVSRAAGELTVGNNDLSIRTERQAESLARTSSSTGELADRTRENAESARQAAELAREASTSAERGGRAVAEIIGTMREIDEGARSIADIIGLIDGIAFQTNILALNAAVEAARAGEQGKGFAVVASEVRSLAQRSATAAREIADLIRNATGRVEAGSRQVDAAGELIRDVVAASAQVTDVIGRISAASSEQDIRLEELSQTIRAADDVTQQNAALVEQATAATASLEQQARSLADVLNVFKTADAPA